MSNSMSSATPPIQSSPIPLTMRAVVAETFGDADVLEIKQVDVPRPQSGEVLIKIAAAGINRPDVLQRFGRYAPPEGVTNIFGLECSGEIVALGEGVHRYSIGDKVCALVSGGGYAEYVAAPEGQCLPIPAGLDMVQAAALPESIFTVWANLFELGQLKENEIALVHGGSSGIGIYAIQMAVAAGAHIIVTVGNDQKAEACIKLGATMVINYRTVEFVKKILDFTKKRGVDVVMDMVGADYVPRNLNVLRSGGRHVTIATQHGKIAAVDMRDLLYRRLTLNGMALRPCSVAKKSHIAASVEQHVWPWIAAGKVKPVIYQCFPLEKVVEAHKVMESSVHIGKIVLTV